VTALASMTLQPLVEGVAVVAAVVAAVDPRSMSLGDKLAGLEQLFAVEAQIYAVRASLERDIVGRIVGAALADGQAQGRAR
jgi:hypothetical protein